MDKLTFINNQEPALNDTNLNQIQTNAENAINATKPHQVNVGTEVDEEYKVNLLKTKNLFDKNTAPVLQAYVDNSQVGTSANARTTYIACKPNTTYTIQKRNDGTQNRFVVATTTIIPANGVSIAQYTANNDASSITITTNSTAKYLVLQFYHVTETIYTEQQALDSIQIEEGSTATEYTPFIHNQIIVDNEKYSDTINVGATEDSRSRVNVLHSRNLIKPILATTTQNGVTCTNNGDGTYTLNGTASATVTFNLLNNLALTGEYKLIGCPAGGSTQTYYMFVRNSAWSKFIGDLGEGKTGTIDTTMKYVDIAISEGTVCNNLVFKPMITKDLSITYADFESYIVPSIKVDNEEIYRKPKVLWEGTADTNIELNDDKSKYDYLKIYFADDQNYQNYIEIDTSNNPFQLQFLKAGSTAGTIYLIATRYYWNNGKITKGVSTGKNITGTSITDISSQAANLFKITKIVGGKY